MSARAAVFQAINRNRTPQQRKLLAALSHAITTAGLLSMIVDSSASLGPRLDTKLSGVVIGVWVYFALVWLIRSWVAAEVSGLGSVSYTHLTLPTNRKGKIS